MSFRSESFLPEQLLQAEDFAYRAAEGISGRLKENFGTCDYSTKSDERDWVTEYDLWAEEQIKADLRKFSRDIGFLGEEYGAEGNQDVHWSIDSIDGSSFFVRGIPYCYTMLSLVDHDVPVASVIYDFVHGKSYSAVAELGAHEDLRKPLHVSSRPLSTAYVEVYTDENTLCGEDLAKSIEAEGAYLLRTAAMGHTLVSIAKGGTEGFVSLRNPFATEWDVAPGVLLIHEAGGMVRNIGSDKFSLKNPDFIASNQEVYSDLRQIAFVNRETGLAQVTQNT